ncbi:MAG: hypothetical protein ABH870_02155 [bacterium]
MCNEGEMEKKGNWRKISCPFPTILLTSIIESARFTNNLMNIDTSTDNSIS